MNFGIILILCCIIIQSCICFEVDITVNETDSSADDLEFFNLLNDVQKLQSSVNRYFIRKNGQMPVEITHMSNEFLILNNRLLIDYSAAEKFLSILGNVIKRLAIEYVSIPPLRHREIGNLVNLYCFESLLEIEVNNCGEGALDRMEKRFKNVESVIFDGEWQKLKNNSLSFGQLFPAMQRLTLIYSDGYILDYNYPKLTELIFISPNPNLSRLLQNNPQIQAMTLRDSSTEFLQIINENLPNLTTIAFDVPNDLNDYNGSKIIFYNVTKASINDFSWNFRSNKFHFEQLETLEVLVEEDFSDEWAVFMANQSGQKFVTIAIANFTENNSLKLPAHLNCSFTLRLGCSLIEAMPMVNFLNNNKDLKNLALNCPQKQSKAFAESLDYALDEEWKISPVNNNNCDFSLTKTEMISDSGQKVEDTSESIPIVTQKIDEGIQQNTTENITENITQNDTNNTTEKTQNSSENSQNDSSESATENTTDPETSSESQTRETQNSSENGTEHINGDITDTPTDNGASILFSIEILALALLTVMMNTVF